MKRQFVKSASAAQMLDAFESKLAEMQGSDIESATSVNSSDVLQLFDDDGYHNYEDTDGIYTGVPGSYVTLAELKNYWNDFYHDDPVLNEEYDPDQGEKWLSDTLRYMKEVDEDVDAATDANTKEIDEDLEPVKGEQQWGDDQVFVLIDYVAGGPEDGMDADSFEPIGKFFAIDLEDAERQLEEVKKTEADRMQFLSNPYVEKYTEYIDDGMEVYPDLATLVKSSWIAPNDFDGNMPEEPVFESDNIECSDDMFTEIEKDIAKDAEEEPIEASMFGDFYFGKEQADKYGDLIASNLSGQTISKRKDLAEEPGGLIYEANLLGIDMWDLLEALEGMCYQGRAMEIDDSTYKVK